MSQFLPQTLTPARLPRSAERILKAGEAIEMLRSTFESSYSLQSILDPDELGLGNDRDAIHDAAMAYLGHDGVNFRGKRGVDQPIASQAASALRRMEMRAEAVTAAFDFLPKPNPDLDRMKDITGVLRALVSVWSNMSAPGVTDDQRRALLEGRDPFPTPTLEEEYGSEPGFD